MATQVGALSAHIISLLGLSGLQIGQPIYLGESNILHMKSWHASDYERYGSFIPDILSSPDYVGQNPSDGSIEYVKQFSIGNDYVKVAVRLSGNHILYARSLYVMNSKRVHNFTQKGSLKKV